MDYSKRTLKVLLMSDCHGNVLNFEQLHEWVREQHPVRYDYVFIPGDMCDVPNKGEEKDFDQVEIERATNQIRVIIQKVNDQIAPVVIIPGNHDPPYLFKEFKGDDMSCIQNDILLRANVHKSTMKIADGLHIFGLGGSTPSTFHAKGGETSKPCWDPYPYKEVSDFNQDLAVIWEEARNLENDDGTPAQLIMMTHEGPRNSPTSNNVYHFEEQNTYKTGTDAVYNLMLHYKDRFLCNIHGHSHDGDNYHNLWKPNDPLPIINPGSLSQGEFGELTFKKNANNIWKVAQVNKVFLV